MREPGVGGGTETDRKRMPENKRTQAETHIKGAEDCRKRRREKIGARKEGSESRGGSQAEEGSTNRRRHTQGVVKGAAGCVPPPCSWLAFPKIIT